jgi:hypothetical protein
MVSGVSPAADQNNGRSDHKKETYERRTSNVQHRTSNKGILSILIAVAPLEKQRDAGTNRSHTNLK